MDEDFKRLVMECNNCHLHFYTKEKKIEPQSNVMVCINCYSLPGSKIKVLKDRPLKKEKPVERDLPPLPAPMQEKPAELTINLPAGYALYRCTKCKYLFKRKGEYNRGCPYCSHQKLTVLKKA